MGNTTFNDIKAYLYITEPDPNLSEVEKGQAIKLEYMNYKCARQRNNVGLPFGTTKETILNFSVYCPSDKVDILYDRIWEMTNSSSTFVFNPIYGSSGKLESFSRAFTATGFVISLNEMTGYDENTLNKRHLESTREQVEDFKDRFGRRNYVTDSITMQVEFLVNQITYFNSGSVNEKSNHKLYINY